MNNNNRPQKQQQPQQQQQKFYQQQETDDTPPPPGPAAMTQLPTGPAALAPGNDNMSHLRSWWLLRQRTCFFSTLRRCRRYESLSYKLMTPFPLSWRKCRRQICSSLAWLGTLLAQNPAAADGSAASPALTCCTAADVRIGSLITCCGTRCQCCISAAAAGVPYNYLDELQNNPPGAAQQQQVPQPPQPPATTAAARTISPTT